jgi:diaminopimelate decarboxylase
MTTNNQDQIALAKKYGTPLFVYDASTIEQRVRELKDFGTIRFAMKALPNLAVLSLMKKLGVVVDCVSLGELKRAKAAGFKLNAEHPEVVYTCDIFDRDSLSYVTENSIAVNMGSIEMIHQYGPIAKRKNITLRINPGFGHGHSQKTNTGGPSSKHGIWHEELQQALAAAKKYDLIVEGIHMHIGSGTDFKHLSTVCDAMYKVVKAVGNEVTMISAGGGLPIPYHKDEDRIEVQKYSELWWNTRDKLAKELGHDMRLEIEPGRYLVAESGSLLTEVRGTKNQGDKKYYLVDAGFNNNARPAMYGAYHHMDILTDNTDTTEEVVVAGPLCESGDVFTQLEGGTIATRELPKAKVGDILVIHDAGAYCASMGSHYNSKSHAAEVLLLNGKDYLIREKENEEELFRHEVIPAELKA